MNVREMMFWTSLLVTIFVIAFWMYFCQTVTEKTIHAFGLLVLVLVSFWRGWIMRDMIEDLNKSGDE